MGKGSMVIVAGDVSQSDIAKSRVSLPSFIDMIKSVKGVGIHMFNETDIVRAKILQDIVKKYDKWKDENNK
jgi:phosphate starvation-inducible protein PhoH